MQCESTGALLAAPSERAGLLNPQGGRHVEPFVVRQSMSSAQGVRADSAQQRRVATLAPCPGLHSPSVPAWYFSETVAPSSPQTHESGARLHRGEARRPIGGFCRKSPTTAATPPGPPRLPPPSTAVPREYLRPAHPRPAPRSTFPNLCQGGPACVRPGWRAPAAGPR